MSVALETHDVPESAEQLGVLPLRLSGCHDLVCQRAISHTPDAD